MAGSNQKQIHVTIFEQNHVRQNWFFDFEGPVFQEFLDVLTRDMEQAGVAVAVVLNRDTVITVNSYADLLNAVRVSSPEDGHLNQCVGHIIGTSEHLDILEDIKKAVRRIAFAPETVAPSSEFRKVCHNCGCGC